MRQQLGPARPRLGVPRHAVNMCDYLVEPLLEIAAPLSRSKQKDSEAYLPEDHGIDRQVALVPPQPLDHSWIRVRLGRLAQHVGVDQSPHDCDPSVSVKLRFNRRKPAFHRAREQYVHQALVVRAGGNQTILPSTHTFDIERLAGLDLVLLAELGWYDDLPLRRNHCLHATYDYALLGNRQVFASIVTGCRVAGMGRRPGQFSGRPTAPEDRFPSHYGVGQLAAGL